MDYGVHCTFDECNRIDFLPIQCNGCKKNYCSSHYQYSSHSCINSANIEQIATNNQIPVCPVCGQTVPFIDGQRSPDDAISRHIDLGCKNQKKKMYTNRCNKKGCKKKELVPINCSECSKNFCLQHRVPTDHECVGRSHAVRNARINKYTTSKPTTSSSNTTTYITRRPGGNSETGKSTQKTQEQLDSELAMQLQMEWNQDNNSHGSHAGQSHRSGNGSKQNCTIS